MAIFRGTLYPYLCCLKLIFIPPCELKVHKVYIVIYTVSSYNKNIGSEISQIYVLRGG